MKNGGNENMSKVIDLHNTLRKSLIDRLKDRGISRISDGRYVDELSTEELRELWKRANIRAVKHNLTSVVQ
jgi:hypothetical protein